MELNLKKPALSLRKPVLELKKADPVAPFKTQDGKEVRKSFATSKMKAMASKMV